MMDALLDLFADAVTGEGLEGGVTTFSAATSLLLGGEVSVFLEVGRPLCMRAGLGLVLPRCWRLGPSVTRGMLGRSTNTHTYKNK